MKDMIVNELSLEGQFSDEQDFEKNLRDNYTLFELQNRLNTVLYSSSFIYTRKITEGKTLSEYLSTSHSDEASKLRVYLLKNFWDTNPSHDSEDKYVCNLTDLTSTYSIAEACERNCSLFSFNHPNYLSENIEIWKNTEKFLIENYTNVKAYIEDNFEDIIDNLWQKLDKNFDLYFRLLLKTFAIKLNFFFIYDYKYSDNFKNRLLNVPLNIRNKSLEQIAKRLSMSREEANQSESLNDEPIKGSIARRFYITKNLGRIHYFIQNNSIIFDSLNTQHDEGLS